MTIGRKLEIGVWAVLALVVAIGIAWMGRLGNLDTDRQSAAEGTARRLQIVSDMDSAASVMLAAMRGTVLYTAAGEPPQAAICRQEFADAAGRWSKSVAALKPLLVQDGERRLVNRMQDRMAAWRSAFTAIEKAAALGDSGAALKIASARGTPIYRANALDTARFRELQDGILEAQRANAASLVHAGWWTDFGALGLAVAAGLMTLFFVRQTSQIAQSTWDRAVPQPELAAALPAGAELLGEFAVPAADRDPSVSPQQPLSNGRGSDQAESEPRPLGRGCGGFGPTDGLRAEAGGPVEGIDSIAFRGDLLQLNNALEAARSKSSAAQGPAGTEESGVPVRRSTPAAGDHGTAAEPGS